MYELKYNKNSNNELRVALLPVRYQGESLREKASAILGVPSTEVGEIKSCGRNPDGTLDIRFEFKTNRIQCNAHTHRRTKFGRYATTRIIRAAGALDIHDPEPSNYLFLTATLPSDEEWAKWSIAEDAHNLINGFKAWLSKRMSSRYEFYVWEHQRREALHFHYCIHVPNHEIRDAIARDFRAQWMRLLDGMEERTGVSAWGKWADLSYEDKYAILQTRTEVVYSSVAQYMAGYCSDGKSKHSKDDYIPYYPKRWFGVSRSLSALISEHTEADSEFYGSYRTAKLAFDEIHEKFSVESLQSKVFRHKVGIGETSVNYHTLKNLNELWQQRKAMKYNRQSHPRIWFWIQTVLNVQRMISELEMSSQIFRELSSSCAIESLKDGLYEGSLRRGTLHVNQVRACETLWLKLSSQSSLPRSLRPLLTALTRFIKVHSESHNKIKWDQHGWLESMLDFEATVDTGVDIGYSRTTADVDGTPSDPDSSRGHVPSEPKFEPSQLSVL